MQKTEFEFTLNNPFTFAAGGNQETAQKLILSAPNNRNAHRVRLQQAFIKAIKNTDKSLSEADKAAARAERDARGGADEDPDGMSIYMMLLASDMDMSVYHGYFRDLICDDNNPCCSIEGLQKMKYATFDKMSADDTDRLLGEYMANFIVASVMQKPEKKSQAQ